MVLREFQHGQSNPTYYVRAGGREMVLRKKPPGKLVKSAHAVEREYTVTRALAQVGIPVAGGATLCEDAAVIGTPFYLMDYVPGTVYTDPRLPGLEPRQRAAAYDGMVKALADIHGADLKRTGLEAYGKPGGYVGRQVRQWSGQYDKNKELFPIPAMEKLIEWYARRRVPCPTDRWPAGPLARSCCDGDGDGDGAVHHQPARLRANRLAP